ncbi:LIM15, partial [Symbiodinium sp. CCMP2456]
VAAQLTSLAALEEARKIAARLELRARDQPNLETDSKASIGNAAVDRESTSGAKLDGVQQAQTPERLKEDGAATPKQDGSQKVLLSADVGSQRVSVVKEDTVPKDEPSAGMNREESPARKRHSSQTVSDGTDRNEVSSPKPTDFGREGASQRHAGQDERQKVQASADVPCTTGASQASHNDRALQTSQRLQPEADVGTNSMPRGKEQASKPLHKLASEVAPLVQPDDAFRKTGVTDPRFDAKQPCVSLESEDTLALNRNSPAKTDKPAKEDGESMAGATKGIPGASQDEGTSAKQQSVQTQNDKLQLDSQQSDKAVKLDSKVTAGVAQDAPEKMPSSGTLDGNTPAREASHKMDATEAAKDDGQTKTTKAPTVDTQSASPLTVIPDTKVELLGVERHKTHPMAFITLNEASAARAIIEQQQESILGVQVERWEASDQDPAAFLLLWKGHRDDLKEAALTTYFKKFIEGINKAREVAASAGKAKDAQLSAASSAPAASLVVQAPKAEPKAEPKAKPKVALNPEQQKAFIEQQMKQVHQKQVAQELQENLQRVAQEIQLRQNMLEHFKNQDLSTLPVSEQNLLAQLQSELQHFQEQRVVLEQAAAKELGAPAAQALQAQLTQQRAHEAHAETRATATAQKGVLGTDQHQQTPTQQQGLHQQSPPPPPPPQPQQIQQQQQQQQHQQQQKEQEQLAQMAQLQMQQMQEAQMQHQMQQQALMQQLQQAQMQQMQMAHLQQAHMQQANVQQPQQTHLIQQQQSQHQPQQQQQQQMQQPQHRQQAQQHQHQKLHQQQQQQGQVRHSPFQVGGLPQETPKFGMPGAPAAEVPAHPMMAPPPPAPVKAQITAPPPSLEIAPCTAGTTAKAGGPKPKGTATAIAIGPVPPPPKSSPKVTAMFAEHPRHRGASDNKEQREKPATYSEAGKEEQAAGIRKVSSGMAMRLPEELEKERRRGRPGGWDEGPPRERSDILKDIPAEKWSGAPPAPPMPKPTGLQGPGGPGHGGRGVFRTPLPAAATPVAGEAPPPILGRVRVGGQEDSHASVFTRQLRQESFPSDREPGSGSSTQGDVPAPPTQSSEEHISSQRRREQEPGKGLPLKPSESESPIGQGTAASSASTPGPPIKFTIKGGAVGKSMPKSSQGGKDADSSPPSEPGHLGSARSSAKGGPMAKSTPKGGQGKDGDSGPPPEPGSKGFSAKGMLGLGGTLGKSTLKGGQGKDADSGPPPEPSHLATPFSRFSAQGGVIGKSTPQGLEQNDENSSPPEPSSRLGTPFSRFSAKGGAMAKSTPKGGQGKDGDSGPPPEPGSKGFSAKGMLGGAMGKPTGKGKDDSGPAPEPSHPGPGAAGRFSARAPGKRPPQEGVHDQGKPTPGKGHPLVNAERGKGPPQLDGDYSLAQKLTAKGAGPGGCSVFRTPPAATASLVAGEAPPPNLGRHRVGGQEDSHASVFTRQMRQESFPSDREPGSSTRGAGRLPLPKHLRQKENAAAAPVPNAEEVGAKRHREQDPDSPMGQLGPPLKFATKGAKGPTVEGGAGGATMGKSTPKGQGKHEDSGPPPEPSHLDTPFSRFSTKGMPGKHAPQDSGHHDEGGRMTGKGKGKEPAPVGSDRGKGQAQPDGSAGSWSQKSAGKGVVASEAKTPPPPAMVKAQILAPPPSLQKSASACTAGTTGKAGSVPVPPQGLLAKAPAMPAVPLPPPRSLQQKDGLGAPAPNAEDQVGSKRRREQDSGKGLPLRQGEPDPSMGQGPVSKFAMKGAKGPAQEVAAVGKSAPKGGPPADSSHASASASRFSTKGLPGKRSPEEFGHFQDQGRTASKWQAPADVGKGKGQQRPEGGKPGGCISRKFSGKGAER